MKVRWLVPAALVVLTTNGFAQQPKDIKQKKEYETTVYERAVEVGLQQCLETTKQLADFLVEGHEHGSHDMWGSDDPDTRMYSSLIVKQYTDGRSHITMTIVPRDGVCDWTYTETYTVERACESIRGNWFESFSELGALNETTTVLSNGEGVNIYLTPTTEASCMVSKREVFIQ